MEEKIETNEMPKKSFFSTKWVEATAWCNEHKGIMRLIIVGIILLFLIMCVLALRSYSIYVMDNYPYYVTGQRLSAPEAAIDSSASLATIVASPDIEGCELYAIIAASKAYSEKNNAEKSYVSAYTYYYRFKNKRQAKKFLLSLDEDDDRDRFVLNNYLFDMPKIISLDENATARSVAEESARSSVSTLPLASIIYRALVAFDFESGK